MRPADNTLKWLVLKDPETSPSASQHQSLLKSTTQKILKAQASVLWVDTPHYTPTWSKDSSSESESEPWGTYGSLFNLMSGTEGLRATGKGEIWADAHVSQEPFVNISINPRGPWVPCGTFENCEKEPRTHRDPVWTSVPFFNSLQPWLTLGIQACFLVLGWVSAGQIDLVWVIMAGFLRAVMSCIR